MLAIATTIAPRDEARKPSRDLSGKRLGRYVVDTLLGRGGMATVWRGVHEELHTAVAIKVLDADVVEGDVAKQRFFREAKLNARLNHDHVVKVIDFASDPDVGSYIVMELLEGQPLDRLLGVERPLDEARALKLAIQIADGLAAAHALGIVHRDLKPGNVFVIRALGREVVKVVDFGIAKHAFETTSALTHPNRVYGTPLYMSPEQWENANVGPASDVYSLGVVVYQMVTGRLPIDGTLITEMARKVALVEPPPARSIRPSLSPGIEELLRSCLRKDPATRPRSMAELRDALERVLGQTTSAPSSRGSPASRLVVGGIVGVVAIGLGILAVRAWSDDRDPIALPVEAPVDEGADRPARATTAPPPANGALGAAGHADAGGSVALTSDSGHAATTPTPPTPGPNAANATHAPTPSPHPIAPRPTGKANAPPKPAKSRAGAHDPTPADDDDDLLRKN